MPRRFLTAEDVHRASGGEIVIDANTLVTPQAAEAARALGVALRTPAGVYEVPTPDRGPDAELAMRSLPNLPEPAADVGAGTGLVVTAVGRNRPGILAEITAAIADLGCDVKDISQKTVTDFFHVVLTVEAGTSSGFEEIKTRLQCMGGEDDYVIRVMHGRVFRFMHRI